MHDVKARSRGAGFLVAEPPPLGYFSLVASRDSHAFYERFTAVMRQLRAAAAKAYATFELGSAQAKLLRHIPRHGAISQADLARATDTAATLTGRALEPLIERGWVRRRRSESDRRQYVLELTSSGDRVRKRVEVAREGVIEQLSGALDEKDVRDFDRIAAKLLVALSEKSDAPTSRD